MNTKSKLKGEIAVLTVLTLLQSVVPLSVAQAAEDPCANVATGTNTNAGTVGGTMTASSAVSQQKATYCEAAKKAEEAAKADKKSMMVWGGVAAVCTSACALSYVNPMEHTSKICMGASVAGGVGDAILTKNLMNGMMGVGAAGASYMMGNSAESNAAAYAKALTAEKAKILEANPELRSLSTQGKLSDAQLTAHADKNLGNNPNADRNDKMSCASAAMAAVQTYMKKQAADENEKTAKENRDAASKLTATTQHSMPTLNLGNDTAATDLTATGANPNGISTLSGNGSSTADASAVAGPCSTPDAGNGAATIACAVASDSNFPNWVQTQGFGDAIKKNTGLGLGDFFNKVSENPSGAIAAGAGKLPGDMNVKLAGILSDTQARVAESSGAAYASGGGGSGGGGGDSGPDFNAMMAGLMGQLNPEAKDTAPGVTEASFGAHRRLASASAEDPSVSIFDRVTYRYSVLKNRMLKVESLSEFGSAKNQK